MDNNISIISIISIAFSPILSSITTLIVLIINKKFDKSKQAREIKILRINKLYMPFYQNCLRLCYPENDTALTKLEIAGLFLDLFSNNIAYMSSDSQKLFKPFYMAFLQYFLPDDDSTPNADELNICFKSIGKSLQEDYKTLCRELRLEQPIELF